MALKTATCVMSATSKATIFPRYIPATVSYQARTPDAPVVVYDSDMNRVAHLPYAYNIGYEKKINQVWSATFYLPYDDPHAGECLPLRFVEIYDGSVRIGLFRITTRKVSHTATRKAWWFQCEHVLATLNDSMLVDVHNAGSTDYTSGAIEYILARQDPVRWELGQCDWSRNFLYRWENVTLLEALLEIPKRFGEDYQWTFDTTSYPWTLNLVSPSTTVAAYIDYSRNLQEITREEDARELYTRLWAYGQGVQGSTAQVSIRDVNPTGEDFIDADTISTYGIIERVWVDQRYTDSQSLYDAAVERLAAHKTPIYRYTLKAADIYPLTGEEIDKFELGAYVMVDDEELGIETSDRVVAISKPDIQGKPGEVSIQLANRMREFTDLTDVIYSPSLDDVVDGGAFARVLSTSIEAGLIKLSAIPGGSLGAFPSPPSIAGLYLGASHMGYHDGSSWITYMDIDGRFKLVGTDSYLEWNPTGGGSLSIKGTVTITSGDTYDDIQQALADAATALEVADGEIVGFYQDTEPTSGMSFGDVWIDTDGASPLDSSCIYRYEDADGGSQGTLAWRSAPTNAVGLVYLNAAEAQATADGKVTTFYQTSAPTAEGVGDLWVDTDDDNKLYRWSGSSWQAVTGALAAYNKVGTVLIEDGAVTADKVTTGELITRSGQIGNALITTAHISSLTVGDAWISDVSVDKLTAGTLDGQYIILADGGYIAQGKTSYNDSTAGFWLGQGGVNALFNIGDANYFLKWTGTEILVKGKMWGTLETDLNFAGHDAYNCSGLRGGTGTSSQWLNFANHTWIGVNTNSYLYLGNPASLNSTGHLYLRSNANCDIILDSDDDIALGAANAAYKMYIQDWSETGGSRTGWIKVVINGQNRYIWLHTVD